MAAVNNRGVEKTAPWKVLLALMPGHAMFFADQTILPVALPTIQREFGTTNLALEWSVNSYLLALTAFLIAGGKIADRIGHRLCFVIGLFLFTLSSAAAGLCSGIEQLIIARIFQGMGAALQLPATTGIIVHLFPQNRRGQAMGLVISVGAIFMVLAPLLGGYLTEYLGWRLIFLINLPIACIGIFCIYLLVPHISGHKIAFDGLGFTAFCLFTFLLGIATMQSRILSWKALGVLYGASALFFVFMLYRERRHAQPFLDLQLYKHRLFRAAAINLFTVGGLLMFTVFWTLYIQDVLEISPLAAGFFISISALPITFMAPIAGRIADRIGPKVPVAFGFLLLMYVFFSLGLFASRSLPLFLLSLFCFGMGIPCVMNPSFASAAASSGKAKAGIASGTLSTLRFFGGACGIAFLSGLISLIKGRIFTRLLRAEGHLEENLFSPLLANPNALIKNASVSQIEQAKGLLKQATTSAYETASLITGFLLILCFALVLLHYRSQGKSHTPDGPAEGWDH